jgi:Arc/MetJ family transcription regulator
MARTTMNVDPELVERVVRETGERNKGRAIDKALEEFLKLRAKERLLALRGAFPDMRDRSDWHEKDLELELEHLKDRKW